MILTDFCKFFIRFRIHPLISSLYKQSKRSRPACRCLDSESVVRLLRCMRMKDLLPFGKDWDLPGGEKFFTPASNLVVSEHVQEDGLWFVLIWFGLVRFEFCATDWNLVVKCADFFQIGHQRRKEKSYRIPYQSWRGESITFEIADELYIGLVGCLIIFGVFPSHICWYSLRSRERLFGRRRPGCSLLHEIFGWCYYGRCW